jgi:hypothetical protein
MKVKIFLLKFLQAISAWCEDQISKNITVYEGKTFTVKLGRIKRSGKTSCYRQQRALAAWYKNEQARLEAESLRIN